MSVLYELLSVESTVREVDRIVSLDSSAALENQLVFLELIRSLPLFLSLLLPEQLLLANFLGSQWTFDFLISWGFAVAQESYDPRPHSQFAPKA